MYQKFGQPIVLSAMDGFNGKHVLSDQYNNAFNFFFCGMLSIYHRTKILLCHVNNAKWLFLQSLAGLPRSGKSEGKTNFSRSEKSGIPVCS